MTTAANAVIGHNEAPDHAKLVTDRLADEYAEITRSVADALEAARALPKDCDDDDAQGEFAAVIKRLRDLDARVEGIRVVEKEPFLRGGNAVDAFFKGLRAKLFRQNKTDQAGAADVLQARVNAYVQKKADEERRRRQEEERVAREQERVAREAREKAERDQRDAEAKAARARNATNIAAAEEAARKAKADAERLRDEEDRARQERQEKAADASAKTADMVRTRTEQGHMVTARQVPFVEITDEMALNPAVLWAFVKSDAKLAALRSWAKTTQYKQQMPGAVIEMRDEAVVR